MKDKYLLETIKQEKLLDRFEEYKKMTREEIEYQLGWGDTNEFSWGFAIYLLTIIDKTREFIKENAILSDEWTEIKPLQFIPTGKVDFKSLNKKKVEKLFKMLIKGE